MLQIFLPAGKSFYFFMELKASCKDNKRNLFIFDPPIKGIGKESLKIIEEYEPKYVVYLSCNPKSLKKELDKILELNNKAEYNMNYVAFPVGLLHIK